MKTFSYSLSTLAAVAMVFGFVATAAAEDMNCDDPQTRAEARRCAVTTFKSDMSENRQARMTVRTDFKMQRTDMKTMHKDEQQEAFAKCREMHAELKASVSDDGMVAYADVEALITCVSEVMSMRQENRQEVQEVRQDARSDLQELRGQARTNVRTFRTNLMNSRSYLRAQRLNGSVNATGTVNTDASAQ